MKRREATAPSALTVRVRHRLSRTPWANPAVGTWRGYLTFLCLSFPLIKWRQRCYLSRGVAMRSEWADARRTPRKGTWLSESSSVGLVTPVPPPPSRPRFPGAVGSITCAAWQRSEHWPKNLHEKELPWMSLFLVLDVATPDQNDQ